MSRWHLFSSPHMHTQLALGQPCPDCQHPVPQSLANHCQQSLAGATLKSLPTYRWQLHIKGKTRENRKLGRCGVHSPVHWGAPWASGPTGRVVGDRLLPLPVGEAPVGS